MAWTAPMTFVANTVLTAAQLNTYVRDNLLETAPAKATTAGSLFVGAGLNQIVERSIVSDYVAASQTITGTTSYSDLATVGPQVTVTTGAQALMFLYCSALNNGTTSSLMAVDITGASTISASDNVSVGSSASTGFRATSVYMQTGLTPGSNTFTAKYKTGNAANIGTFQDRRMTVLPL